MRSQWCLLLGSCALALAAAAPAAAEPILKCVDASGRVEYRNSSCPRDRRATIVDTQKSPPAIESERRLEAIRKESAAMTERLQVELMARRELTARATYMSGAYYVPQVDAPVDQTYVPLYGGYFPPRPCNSPSCGAKPKQVERSMQGQRPMQGQRSAPVPQPLPVPKR